MSIKISENMYKPTTINEPIAVIGIGCRFPGANNPSSYWENLIMGTDSITEIPAERWSLEDYYNAKTNVPGKMITRWGGFLDDVDQFDSNFFNISPREAEKIDPQQRLLLEVSWEALESSGIVPSSLAGSNTGVFVGISNSDYSRLPSGGPASLNAYSGTGTSFSIAANRISYSMDLKGPSLSVDTACSSSLVAVHLACQSLRSGESSMCLVGGVNLMLSPEATIVFSQAQMMAIDGRCKTFDALADGYVRGEGCGVVILKPLKQAVKDQDNILALIRGSAVNQDGLTNGITAPNGPSQQYVIRQALKNAKVTPEQISYVEAHGTGTTLGDPIEYGALKAVLMKDRQLDHTCWLGSVKTNIGHLESAAGMAGLLKVVLSLRHQKIPPHLHFKNPNPYISFEDTSFSIPVTPQDWKTNTPGARLAGISGFGFGGTNCHLIIQEYETQGKQQQQPQETAASHLIIPLSAKTEKSLKILASKYLDFLKAGTEASLSDICFTASTRRSNLSCKLVLISHSKKQLQEKLSDFIQGKTIFGLVKGKTKPRKKPKVAFLFTGQGSQYLGMGKQLYSTQQVFRKALDKCNDILRPYLNVDLIKIIHSNDTVDSRINETTYTQPSLFALEYAIAQLWISWGIKPNFVMGHSVGEYVAATIAEVFSLEDGLKLIVARARLMGTLPKGGEMYTVLASEDQVQQVLAGMDQEISIAAVNGPQNTVVSGSEAALDKFKNRLAKLNIKVKRLQVSHAFHSHLMEPMMEEFQEVVEAITYNTPNIQLISNVTGTEVLSEISNPSYWVNHVQATVRFSTGMKSLHSKGCDAYVEIGPRPTLLGMGKQCVPEDNALWLPSIRPKRAESEQLLESLASLYVAGKSVNWNALYKERSVDFMNMPTYAFDRNRHWLENQTNDVQNSINKLPKQQETGDLIRQLEQIKELSPEEIKVLPKLLELLSTMDRQQQNEVLVNDWFFEMQWRKKPYSPEEKYTEKKGLWLVFCDSEGLGEYLATRLEELGHYCMQVYPSTDCEVVDSKTRKFCPTDREAYKSLFQDTKEIEGMTLHGIVHLWGMETEASESLDGLALEKAQELGCISVLHIVQALAIQHRSVLSRLWLVTRNAQSICSNKDQLAIAQAPLWGMGKVVALEHPNLWGGLIDLALDSKSLKNDVELLIPQLLSDEREDHIAFRDNERHVARLVKSEIQESSGLDFKKDGTYLITGGLGALGLQVARWMAVKGADNLVLTGRREATGDTRKTIDEIMAKGTKVIVAQVDVTDKDAMAKLFKTIEKSMPPLKGVVHIAGVLDDRILLKQDQKSFGNVMAPKVQGALNLHLLTKELSLDFFTLFSSVSSLMGAPGQGNYAAANTFIDALAHYRRAKGLKGMSINWGPWSDIGMAAQLKGNEQMRITSQGIKQIPLTQGLQALEYVLRSNTSQVGVMPIDWSLLQSRLQGGNTPMILSELLLNDPYKKQSGVITGRESHGLWEKLEAVPVADREKLLLAYLQEYTAKTLGMETMKIDLQQPLNYLGLDSLMAMELRNQIITELDVEIAIERFLEGISLAELAQLTLEQKATGAVFVSDQSTHDIDDDIEEFTL